MELLYFASTCVSTTCLTVFLTLACVNALAVDFGGCVRGGGVFHSALVNGSLSFVSFRRGFMRLGIHFLNNNSKVLVNFQLLLL